MTQFWPKRSAPEGFSIEKLAKSYRAKLSGTTYDTKHLSLKQEPPLEKSDFANSLAQASLQSEDDLRNTHSNHWANRDFNEYYLAA